jgi:hypothetical protein
MNYFTKITTALLSMFFAGVSIASEPLNRGDTATSSTTPMIVRYYDRGTKDSRHAYKFELIARIMEATRTEYGEYTLAPFGDEPSDKRQAMLISEGKILNLLWATPGTVIARADVISIPVDILRGLLGYRVCLINPANFPDTATLQSPKSLSIAQGLNWADNQVYHHNDLHTKQAASFEALFEMLAAKRYECLPLGSNEVVHTWRYYKTAFPFLAVEPNILIYYDHPIYLYVSKQFPLLAERVELGLKKLQHSGEFDRLFQQYHAADVAQLNLRQRKVFCLQSPYLSAKDQCEKPPSFAY